MAMTTFFAFGADQDQRARDRRQSRSAGAIPAFEMHANVNRHGLPVRRVDNI
jgi:hypothetical protein